MRKYIIMGPQGAGKGTQARLLARDFGLVHISVGDIFTYTGAAWFVISGMRTPRVCSRRARAAPAQARSVRSMHATLLS